MKQLNWYQIFGNTHTIPDGRTVTPTDDIQIWLNCADIWDKSYTTLAEVLADTDTLLALITSNNAVDYMVRSTTWAVSQTLVPVMTDNTHPSGECSASSTESPRYPWKAFDNNLSTFWNTNGATGSAWVQYKWDTPCTVYGYYIKLRDLVQQDAIKLSISSDGVTFTDITENISVTQLENKGVATKNIGEGTICRLTSSGASGYGKYAEEIQFYTASITIDPTAMTYIGQNNYAANTLLADSTWCNAIAKSDYREDVLNVKNPNMTSATTPSGKVTRSGAWSTALEGWKAFDGDNSTYWYSAVNTYGYVQYEFDEEIVPKCAVINNYNAAAYRKCSGSLVASVDGINYDTLYTFNDSEDVASGIAFPNNQTAYKYFKVVPTSYNYVYNVTNNSSTIAEIKIYGREDV